MRCAVWTGGREFQIEERPRPEPGPGEVRVRVHACGICMTEVHTIEGLLGQPKPPRILGHEFGGRIDAIGPGVHGLEVGTLVACGGQGGFSEYVVLGTERVFQPRQRVALDQIVFVEPLACCVAAVHSANLPIGATVLITGAGPMGLLMTQLAKRGGAARVLVSEPNQLRRALALQLGADQVIDPVHESLEEAVQEFTRGEGIDAAFETAGVPAPLSDCLRSTRDGGIVVMVGVNPRSARFDLELYPFHRRNLTLKGSYGGHSGIGFESAVTWLGQLDLNPIISHRFDLANVADAFAAARNGEGAKVLVYPGASGKDEPADAVAAATIE